MTLPQQISNVIPGANYIVNPFHRNGTPSKSQWTISAQQEIASFSYAHAQSWVCANCAWGLHFVNQNISYLGTAQDHATRVFIAKFVNDINHNNWHGYPADHQINQQDIPDEPILLLWLSQRILPKAKIKKIASGKPCRL